MIRQRMQVKVKQEVIVVKRLKIVKMQEPGHYHSHLNTSEEATCPLSAGPLPRC